MRNGCCSVSFRISQERRVHATGGVPLLNIALPHICALNEGNTALDRLSDRPAPARSIYAFDSITISDSVRFPFHLDFSEDACIRWSAFAVANV